MTTSAGLIAFNVGAAGAQNIYTLFVLRFFAGAIGSSPLTSSGGVIADMFPVSQWGLAMCVFASAPVPGPTQSPIVGGFAGESIGWRLVEGIVTSFTGVQMWIGGMIVVPETYAPFLLKSRATKLSSTNGRIYVRKMKHDKGKQRLVALYKSALS